MIPLHFARKPRRESTGCSAPSACLPAGHGTHAHLLWRRAQPQGSAMSQYVHLRLRTAPRATRRGGRGGHSAPGGRSRAAASAALTSAVAVAPRWGSNCPGPLRAASLHCSAPVAAAASPGRRTCGSSAHLCLHDDNAAAAETCQCCAHTLAPTTHSHATTGESQDTCTITALRRRSRQPPTS